MKRNFIIALLLACFCIFPSIFSLYDLISSQQLEILFDWHYFFAVPKTHCFAENPSSSSSLSQSSSSSLSNHRHHSGLESPWEIVGLTCCIFKDQIYVAWSCTCNEQSLPGSIYFSRLDGNSFFGNDLRKKGTRVDISDSITNKIA